MHQGSGPSTLLGEGERGILTGGAHGFYQPFLEIVVGGEVGALEVVGNRVDLVEQCGDGCNFSFPGAFSIENTKS
jgi:hypothetical protein